MFSVLSTGSLYQDSLAARSLGLPTERPYFDESERVALRFAQAHVPKGISVLTDLPAAMWIGFVYDGDPRTLQLQEGECIGFGGSLVMFREQTYLAGGLVIGGRPPAEEMGFGQGRLVDPAVNPICQPIGEFSIVYSSGTTVLLTERPVQ